MKYKLNTLLLCVKDYICFNNQSIIKNKQYKITEIDDDWYKIIDNDSLSFWGDDIFIKKHFISVRKLKLKRVLKNEIC